MADEQTPVTPGTVSPDGLSIEMNDPKAPVNAPPVVPSTQDGEADKRKFAGEFDSVEELEAKYRELLDKQNALAEEGAKKKEEEEGDGEKDKPFAVPETREAADEVLSAKGLNVQDFENEYAANGCLSEESYAKLEKAGFKREMVDQYIRSSEIISENMVNTLMESVGGKERYLAMTTWAKDNLPPADVAGYNEVMYSGNTQLIRMAMQNLHYRYTEANGSKPANMVTGRTSAATGQVHDGFRSTAEMVAAMRDPRYSKDPAYTQDVERRVALSNF